ncbi:MAG: gliding motility-associated C-terminal domain-containing protein, partial [Bacteroidia bacterium]|nr:gliding motility-associated C-terminal domain-containing protein [Bacteroidia bacterium]
MDSQWDTVQCGRNYGGLNSEIPPEGHGYWVDNLGTTDFYPPAPDNYNVDSAVVESYGLHIFYWVVRNGIRPNGTSVCVDSSDAVPIRFIEIPVANAGGNAHNWGNGSEIKTDTACGLEYALDPYITGSPVGQWQTTGWPNRGFVSTNSNTSGMANDTAFSTIYNSDNPLNPYYEFIWQVDNSVIDAPPYSHGCIDRDTLRITFARIPTGQIESRNPYCYGDTALLTPWFDPNGKPDHFTWNFNNGAIESVRPNPSTNQFDSIFMVSWDTTGHTMYHIVSLVSTNSWGCYSNIVTDTIFEPAPLYPLDSIVPTTCMQANGKIFVFPIDLLSTTYFWLDPEFASNPTALFQIDLPPDHPYHIRFRYESWSPNIFCNDTLIILIPDTGKVTASYDTAVLHQEHLIPGYSELFFTNTSVGGKRYEWHFGDGSTSTAENPSHIYTSLEKSDKGCFHVYLIAWSKEECEDWSDSGLVCLESVSELIVPNIFSPNGDEKNDYFQVSGKTLKSFHGIITNRWGKTLYEWDEWDKEL